MPVPDSVTTRVVQGTYVDSAGVPQRGTVTFRLDQPLIATVEAWGVVPSSIPVVLDSTGFFTIELMVSDDIDLFPSGFRYRVQERFQHGYVRDYSIDLPADDDALDLPTTAQYDPGDVGLAVVHSINGRTGIVQLTPIDFGAVPLTQKGAALGVATLDSGGKVPTSQLPSGTGAVASVDGRTGVVTLSDRYSLLAHTHTYPVTSVNTKTGVVTLVPSDIGAVATALLAANSGVATLDSGGKLLGAQLPSLAITDVFDAANQSAMLALSAQKGDLARRTDTNQTYVLTATDPSVLSNWKLLLTPADAVTSVNSLTGAVVLTAASVGAVATSARGAANGVASLDSGTLVPVAQIPNLPASRITSGVIDINRIPTGSTSTTVPLGNHTHSYIATSARGVANGVASLDGSGKVPSAQLPAGGGGGAVDSVNGHTGVVVLTAADVSALATTTRGAASGVASLDSSTLVPVAQIPALPASRTTSGTFDIARIPTGTSSSTVSLGDHAHAIYALAADKGLANGIATLDAFTKVTFSQMPTGTTGTTVALGDHNHDTTYVALTSVGIASGVAGLDSSTLVPVAQIPNLATTKITSGTFDIARIPTGSSGTTVSLGNHTHGYIPTTEKGANSGVATLDSGGKVPTAQLPVLASVASVNGFTGVVVLAATDVGAIATTQKGAASGVASLDGSTLVPTAQIPNLSATKITSGTLDVARVPTGTTSTTVSLGNHTHAYIPTTDRGAASGVAPLDSSTRLPAANLTTYVLRGTVLGPTDSIPGDLPVGALVFRYSYDVE